MGVISPVFVPSSLYLVRVNFSNYIDRLIMLRWRSSFLVQVGVSLCCCGPCICRAFTFAFAGRWCVFRGATYSDGDSLGSVD